jgi:DNA polymerase-3 subunit alpha
MEEIAAVKPPLIVACGSEIARVLLPDLTGPVADSVGKVVYSKELDANILVGLTPGMIYVDPSKMELLVKAFQQALELMC